MVLVDTSVVINLLRGKNDRKTSQVLDKELPFGISILTYQEILQGARDDTEWNTLNEYLSTQVIYYLPNDLPFFKKTAEVFFNLRRKGITPRGTIDVLIASTAIENELYLLHNDKDFDTMKQHLPKLQILESL